MTIETDFDKVKTDFVQEAKAIHAKIPAFLKEVRERTVPFPEEIIFCEEKDGVNGKVPSAERMAYDLLDWMSLTSGPPTTYDGVTGAKMAVRVLQLWHAKTMAYKEGYISLEF